jgi:hypothetical protein
LSNLPERIRVEWPNHRLFGVELDVHGWRYTDGEVQLRVRLADGSIGCLPAAWTNLFGQGRIGTPSAFVSLAALRDLRQRVAALSRRRPPRTQKGRSSAQP